ncbi:MAG: hypothetical protein AB1459_02275 [Pseudomonadota bacterium]
MPSGDRPYDLLQSNAAPPEHDEYQEHREREQREFGDYYRDNPDLIA